MYNRGARQERVQVAPCMSLTVPTLLQQNGLPTAMPARVAAKALVRAARVDVHILEHVQCALVRLQTHNIHSRSSSNA
jgi:hypothetical protein